MADTLVQMENQLEGKQFDLALIKQHFSEVNGEAAGLKGALKALEKERSDHGKRDAEVAFLVSSESNLRRRVNPNATTLCENALAP